MKIMVPLNDSAYLEKYVEAGADEFYIGFQDDGWKSAFGELSDMNRMSGFEEKANQTELEHIMFLIMSIKSYRKAVYITFNANCYSESQITYIQENYFPKFRKIGVDGIIVSTPNLGTAVIQSGFSPIASTMCTIYNSDILLYYYNLGFRRFIFPRDITLDEIQMMTKRFPDAEFEAFFMRNGCVFSDGYCLGTHKRGIGALCSFLRSSEKIISTDYCGFKMKHDIELNDYIYKKAFHKQACGMCALFKLQGAGITSLKIVGRADSCEEILRDIELTKRNIQIMSECYSEKEYLEKMELPYNSYELCQLGFNCYYPEVRF